MLRTRTVLIVVGIVAVIGVLWWNGSLMSVISPSDGTVEVQTGYNEFKVPSSWPDSDAISFLSHNPSCTSVAVWQDGTWLTHTAGSVNNFAIHPGDTLKVYAIGNGILVKPSPVS